MTYNYNVSRWASANYFAEAIEELKLGDAEPSSSIILDIHNKFFDFMENRAFDNVFARDRNLFLDKVENSDMHYPGAHIYLKKNNKPKETVYKINNMRWKFQQFTYGPEVDVIKGRRSLPANIIQAADAKFAHHIINNMACIPIHDSFIVSVEDCHILMDEANLYFRPRLGNKGQYSIFILL